MDYATSPLIFVFPRGIGLETSYLFASEGANVLLVDINLENAKNGADLILKRIPNVIALATKADVGKEADVKAAVDLAVQQFGRLDIMVGKPLLFTREFNKHFFASSIMPVCIYSLVSPKPKC